MHYISSLWIYFFIVESFLLLSACGHSTSETVGKTTMVVGGITAVGGLVVASGGCIAEQEDWTGDSYESASCYQRKPDVETGLAMIGSGIGAAIVGAGIAASSTKKRNAKSYHKPQTRKSKSIQSTSEKTKQKEKETVLLLENQKTENQKTENQKTPEVFDADADRPVDLRIHELP